MNVFATLLHRGVKEEPDQKAPAISGGRLRCLRLNPAEADEILLAAILPPAAIVVRSFRRIIFSGVPVDTADAGIDISQAEIFTSQTNFLHIVHIFFLTQPTLIFFAHSAREAGVSNCSESTSVPLGAIFRIIPFNTAFGPASIKVSTPSASIP